MTGYFFTFPPPIAPQLWFAEDALLRLAMFGALACPYTDPLYAVYPSPGQVGWWKAPGSAPGLRLDGDLEEGLAAVLPGLRLSYEPLLPGTITPAGQSWLWVLTDQVVQWHWQGSKVRLGVWPD